MKSECGEGMNLMGMVYEKVNYPHQNNMSGDVDRIRDKIQTFIPFVI